MKMIPVRTGRRAMLSASILTVLAFTIVTRAAAQDVASSGPAPAGASADTTEQRATSGAYQTIYLSNVTSDNDARDIVTDLRNMLPQAKFYYVSSQHALSMEGSAGDIQSAQKMLSEIDHPLKTYRLTYAFTEMDGDKTVGTRKVSVIALDSGDNTTFKQGSKVPIITGTTGENSSAQNSQVQYVDVGLTIEASVHGSSDALRLRTKIAQSSVSDERVSGNTGDPAIRQTALEAGATLVPGTPLIIGSLDVPGSTHHEEISVVSELVR
jgi:hypothetical protein